MNLTQRKKLLVESLELRTMMAGDVAAVVDANGSLHVTGDSADNGIVITQSAEGTYEVAGDASTTINGQALGVAASLTGVTQSVRIDLGAGDDSATLEDLAIPRHLSLHGRGGDDTLLLSNLAIGGNAIVKGGAGIDDITAVEIEADRVLSIDGGKGKDTLDVSASSGDLLLINSRNGKDVVVKADLDFDLTLQTNKRWSSRVADIVFDAWERVYA